MILVIPPLIKEAIRLDFGCDILTKPERSVSINLLVLDRL